MRYITFLLQCNIADFKIRAPLRVESWICILSDHDHDYQWFMRAVSVS